jgi:hypothetical protein
MFKIPRFVLKDSELFQDMFSVPTPSGAVVDGSDDNHPLHLKGYRADEFKQLLRVILPLCVVRSATIAGPELMDASYDRSTVAQEEITWQQWSSVLKLATMWGFYAVRQKAIKELSKLSMDPVDKIILSKKYDLTSWLVPALNELARREERLSVQDARRLSVVAGWEFPIQVGHVRETHSATPSVKVNSISWPCTYGCTIYNCYSHGTSVVKGSPNDSFILPCPTCTTYRCTSHSYQVNINKPQAPAPRSQHDFTPEIRQIFDISD